MGKTFFPAIDYEEVEKNVFNHKKKFFHKNYDLTKEIITITSSKFENILNYYKNNNLLDLSLEFN